MQSLTKDEKLVIINTFLIVVDLFYKIRIIIRFYNYILYINLITSFSYKGTLSFTN